MNKLIDWFADRPQWVFIAWFSGAWTLLVVLVILVGVWTS